MRKFKQVLYNDKSLANTACLNTEKLYRGSGVNSMDQSASVAGKIATSNEVVVFSGTDGE
jgi:hypothetical protein